MLSRTTLVVRLWFAADCARACVMLWWLLVLPHAFCVDLIADALVARKAWYGCVASSVDATRFAIACSCSLVTGAFIAYNTAFDCIEGGVCVRVCLWRPGRLINRGRREVSYLRHANAYGIYGVLCFGPAWQL